VGLQRSRSIHRLVDRRVQFFPFDHLGVLLGRLRLAIALGDPPEQLQHRRNSGFGTGDVVRPDSERISMLEFPERMFVALRCFPW
jgi:hypothetical protein